MLIGSSESKVRAAVAAEHLAHQFGRDLVALNGNNIAQRQAAIFDGHHPGRVKAAMEVAGDNPNLTVADASSIAACWVANALSLMGSGERSATLAAILCIANGMIAEADGPANPN